MAKAITSEAMHKMVGFDEVTKSKGLFTVYKGYFYTFGYDQDKMAEKVKERLGADKVEIVSTKNQFKAFNGGAPLRKQSYFSVTFKYLG